MKNYLVQAKYPDGEIEAYMRNAYAICDMFGFRDCTDCEYEVFDVSEFGKVVRLEHNYPCLPNCTVHEFINTETGEVEFEGVSAEH